MSRVRVLAAPDKFKGTATAGEVAAAIAAGAKRAGHEAVRLPLADGGEGTLAALGGRLVPGFDLIAAELALDRALGAADRVITGEGHLDGESFAGKVVGGVAARAAAAGRPELAVAGGHDAGMERRIPVVSLVGGFGERARSEPLRCIESAVFGALASTSRPQGAML